MTDDRRMYDRTSSTAPAVEISDIAPPPHVFELDIDAFVERVSELAGETRRRAGSSSRTPPRPALARDGARPPKPPKLELVLYMSAESEKSQRAVRAIEDVLRHYDRSQVDVKTCDLASRPEEGEADSVVFTPMLVKRGTGPRTAIIGNLEDRQVLHDLLDASGIDRRWDD